MSKLFGKTAVLLSVQSDIGIEGFESINELEELCKTLDIIAVDKVIQRRNKPDPVFYFGIGKLEKVKEFCKVNNVDLLVVDDELTPIQQRNVEKFVEVRTVDRTQIILEIFQGMQLWRKVSCKLRWRGLFTNCQGLEVKGSNFRIKVAV